MKLTDPKFVPVTCKRKARNFWVAQTPDRKLAWFGRSACEVVKKAQVYLGQNAEPINPEAA